MRQLHLIFTLIFMTGCALHPAPSSKSTVERIAFGPEGSEAIAFSKVIIRIPAGSQVGTEFSKKGRKGGVPIHWKTNLFLRDEEFKLSAIDELQKYGYTVVGAEELLFERSIAYDPRFLLGGMVTELSYNRFGPEAGNYTTALVAVDWQLYDENLRKVVFKSRTEGEIRTAKDQSTAAVLLAFGRALDSLLTQREFASLVARTPKPTSSEKEDSDLIVPPCTSLRVLSLPDGIEKALDAIVVVRAGGSLGTGVIISREGFVLTAAHVVKGVKAVRLQMKSGLILDATVLRSDEEWDIALVKAAGTGFNCLPLRMDREPMVGEDVFALGTPAGVLDFSVSKGVVSAVRELGGRRLVQTDASVNAGNSGGPLLDKSGHVIAIVSWKLRPERGYEGIAFGVPAQEAVRQLHLVF
jgi:S1-C subfamily serine protease